MMQRAQREGEEELESTERGELPSSPAPPFSSSCYKPPQAACTATELEITFTKCSQSIQANLILLQVKHVNNTNMHIAEAIYNNTDYNNAAVALKVVLKHHKVQQNHNLRGRAVNSCGVAWEIQ